MTSGHAEVQALLAEQIRHQVQVLRSWWPWWIPWLFVLGFFFSALGLFTSIASFREFGKITVGLIAFAVFFLLFGWAVVRWMLPFRPKPRIVPYFAKELAPLGGSTMHAFSRGRALYLHIDALEVLAGNLGVRPLSAFGFAYDHFAQEVRWHPASEGLATVQTLREGKNEPRVAEDLEALASVLEVAAEKDVPFSLVLRLHEKDSMQTVCTRETRQGSFW